MGKGPIDDKRRHRPCKARTQRLPATYHTAIDARSRTCSTSDRGTDLVDLFEQSAADGTPLREIVGEDPMEFADAFLANYPRRVLRGVDFDG
ncbi:DUF1048 domain-containing protein [Nonomuraea sp. NPDC000554]|uniref:DUF1048 domain-containing protein n=1 Tax=Nonomuraea sp. NPDC000554 TaxID=3154259 RepID=UPI00331CDFBD